MELLRASSLFRFIPAYSLCLCLGVLASCGGGGGDDDDDSGNTNTSGTNTGGTNTGGTNTGGTNTGGTNTGTTGSTVQANFESIQSEVFNKSCAVSGCHTGSSAPLGLNLDAGASYGLLVNQASVQMPSVLRVAPSDPDNSYLIRKLEGNNISGSQMPRNRAPLAQADIDMIRQWITDGAQNSATPTSKTAPKITVVTPNVDASVLTQLPQSITVVFDQEMDASSINSGSIQLIRSGNDGNFDDGGEEVIIPASVQLDTVSMVRATIDLSNVAQIADRYMLTLSGAGASTVASMKGDSLDGDNNGTAGGDVRYVFDVIDSSDDQ